MWPDARCFGTGHWLPENSVGSVNQSRLQIGCLSLGEAQRRRMSSHVHIRATHAVGQRSTVQGRVIQIIKTALPSGRPITLEFPVDEQGMYMVTVDTGTVWKSQVSVDQYSGAVVRVQGPQAARVGDHVLGWLFPLHTGQAFGLQGRIVLVILGVIPTCLYMTGFFLWWNRRRTCGT